MISLNSIQKSFINFVKDKMEDSLQNGADDAVLPLYKYKNSIFDSPTLPALDPTYPPYDTVNPSLRESTKLPFMSFLASLINSYSSFALNYSTVELLNGAVLWENPPNVNLQIAQDMTGLIHLTGGFKAGVNIPQLTKIAVLPYQPKFPIIFTGAKNSAPFTFILDIDGSIRLESGGANSGEWLAMHLTFRLQ